MDSEEDEEMPQSTASRHGRDELLARREFLKDGIHAWDKLFAANDDEATE